MWRVSSGQFANPPRGHYFVMQGAISCRRRHRQRSSVAHQYLRCQCPVLALRIVALRSDIFRFATTQLSQIHKLDVQAIIAGRRT